MKIDIPQSWRDVSAIRQVPDHQEVFQDFVDVEKKLNLSDESPYKGTGGCIVIEILERQHNVSDNDAAAYFFNDLAQANSSDDQLNTDVINKRVWPQEKMKEEAELNLPIKNNVQTLKGGGGFTTHLVPQLKAHANVCSCTGIQCITNKDKNLTGKASKVEIELCVIRLEALQTELLVTLTMPRPSGNQKNIEGHSKLFREVMTSFLVEDWSLFC